MNLFSKIAVAVAIAALTLMGGMSLAAAEPVANSLFTGSGGAGLLDITALGALPLIGLSAVDLGSRAIIGELYKTLKQDLGNSWMGRVSMLFTSDQESETYKWLGMVPGMREWIGGRQAKGFRSQGFTATNVHYESTLEVLQRELRRDKTGQLMVRVREQARRANAHWNSLLTTDIINGESTACYDGEFFFDTDHSEGDSGTQSNDISVDISALATTVHGTTTAPSVEEMSLAITTAIAQILTFKDDQGELMNEDATRFLVMVPVSLWIVAERATSTIGSGSGFASQLDLNMGKFTVEVVANARLDASWTTKFAVFRTDAEVKPLIRQEETPIQVAAKAEGSEYEFDHQAHQYGLDAWRTTTYGFWQDACLVTLV